MRPPRWLAPAAWLAVGLAACAGASPPSLSPLPSPEASSLSAEALSSPEPEASGSTASETPPPPASGPPAPLASASASQAPFACAPPDRGWGKYERFAPLPRGKISFPVLDGVPDDGAFDVYLHFHASDAVRREFVGEGYPMVFVGFDLGEGSKAYGKAFDDPTAFVALQAQITQALREKTGDSRAHIRRTVLSSWSAGFAASTRILKQHPDKVAGVILLDSLYAPYAKDERGEIRQGVVYEPPLRGVISMGKQALSADKFLFLTFSRAETHGYASTEEVARLLLERLGLRAHAVEPGDDPRGMIARLDRARVHLRGHRGTDAKAHCNHLRYAGEAVHALREAWAK